jgi:ABC-2 type transport system permease protein
MFSVLFRQPATAALAGIAAWIFFTFFVTMIADAIASALVTLDMFFDPNALLQLENLRLNLARLSPSTLFQEATVALLMPKVRTLGPLLVRDLIGMLPNPLPLSASLVIVWPQIAGLLAVTAFCFAIAYIRFMTQEIRSL